MKEQYTINEILADKINPDHIIKVPLKTIDSIRNI